MVAIGVGAMAAGHGKISGPRAALRRLPFMALVGLAVSTLALAAMLLFRYDQISLGKGGVESPRIAYGDSPARYGRFQTSVTLTTPGAPHDAELHVPLVWDDSWFAGDERIYNRDLASASSVLSALAYSESGYYQAGSSCPAYMERALEQLGFERASTDSYRYRSEVLDQILNLFTQKEDSVAYTIARKVVGGSEGRSRCVIFVSVRGSYGAEWLSNFDITDAATSDGASAATDEILSGAATAKEGACARSQEEDHAGYSRAADEIASALRSWVASAHDRGEDVSLLLVGHSRGGAIANLVASMADDDLSAARTGAPVRGGVSRLSLASRDRVFAYTFASPNTTTRDDAFSSCYDNIFNIVNPSDIMPYLPLGSWGYRRYGVTLELPAIDDDGFGRRHEAMCARFRTLVGTESPYDPSDAREVSELLSDIGTKVHSARDLTTPVGIASVLASCAARIDPVRILYGHYPCTYIAWMQSLDADGLRRMS
ncbi:lipase class 3 [Coriobacterium glomerans PW2]|uniref:Lipase class 3 n=1 Tax=Coriobacterium glomerans (strain ATCC 49209 / DSM 20642 / JCM 10262 / PW2) TaxID=700015 RepID=F2N6Y8_CORGP|nr:lipase class 3 [Coriobacterium glomerans]AEB06187.1 lipase class 3 [Coriobacterium glomerans PW2]